MLFVHQAPPERVGVVLLPTGPARELEGVHGIDHARAVTVDEATQVLSEPSPPCVQPWEPNVWPSLLRLEPSSFRPSFTMLSACVVIGARWSSSHAGSLPWIFPPNFSTSSTL